MQQILQNAHTIAKKHKVLSIQDMDDQIHFKMRSGTPTLLIVAPWSSEKTPIWEKAVQEMIVSLAELSKASSISEGDIHVEIITMELEGPIYLGPLRTPPSRAPGIGSVLKSMTAPSPSKQLKIA
ncbi:hypothetical protein ACKRZS_007645 [Fusarium odoratissimum]